MWRPPASALAASLALAFFPIALASAKGAEEEEEAKGAEEVEAEEGAEAPSWVHVVQNRSSSSASVRPVARCSGEGLRFTLCRSLASAAALAFATTSSARDLGVVARPELPLAPC